MKYRLSALVLIAMLAFSARGFSQAVSAIRGGGTLSAFGTFSYAQPDYGPDHLYGTTFGAFFQKSRFLGLEVRGSELPFHSPFHQWDIVGGPRIAFRFNRFQPYVGVFGGIGHADFGDGAYATNAEFQFAGGADYRLNKRFQIRLVDYSYAHLYVLKNGLNPTTVSSGVVFRIF